MRARPATDETRRTSDTRGIGADLVAAGAAGALVAAAIIVGYRLNQHGDEIRAPIAPLVGVYKQQLGWGTPLSVIMAILIVAYGPVVAARLRWPTLLLTAWASSIAWIVALGLIDGWGRLASRLSKDNEYLAEIPDAPPIHELLTTFTDRIVISDGTDSWVAHVAGHPPGALLFFLGLDRLGLGGGAAAAAVVIALGGSACVAVAIAIRALDLARDGERLARRALPFLVLTPAAVWLGVSADGMFLAVSAWGIALLAVAARARGAPMVVAATGAGLLLGLTVYLSYGLILLGAVAVAVLIATRRVAPGIVAAVAALAVAAVFTAGGFAWWEGLDSLVIRYYQRSGGVRPYSYWVWANLAALAICVGPAVAPALRRIGRSTYDSVRARRLPTTGVGTAALTLGAVVAIAAASWSGLSKAEVERIWLPFGFWLIAACAFLPARHHRRWLAGQALVALVVEHLVRTAW